MVWENRGGAPGFRVYNLGLNTIHLPGRDLSGSRAGKEVIELAAISAEHIGWVPPNTAIKIGDDGPVLRLEELPPDPDDTRVDPDATVFE